MCGRYTITVTWDELVLRFELDQRPGAYHPRYNAAPGQDIPAILGPLTGEDPAGEPLNRLGTLRWGLVPSWSQDSRSAVRMINARAETAADKPAFRQLLRRKRCLIPADGFYEWKREGSSKQPMRFRLGEGELFAMAALYDTWAAPDGSRLHTCAILTTAANSLVSPVHERMPVILPREAEAVWLDRRLQDERELLSLLQSFPAERMTVYPVDRRVGQVSFDEAACIEPAQLPGS